MGMFLGLVFNHLTRSIEKAILKKRFTLVCQARSPKTFLPSPRRPWKRDRY